MRTLTSISTSTIGAGREDSNKRPGRLASAAQGTGEMASDTAVTANMTCCE